MRSCKSNNNLFSICFVYFSLLLYLGSVFKFILYLLSVRTGGGVGDLIHNSIEWRIITVHEKVPCMSTSVCSSHAPTGSEANHTTVLRSSFGAPLHHHSLPCASLSSDGNGSSISLVMLPPRMGLITFARLVGDNDKDEAPVMLP
jgi:hypothetical protein